MDDKEAASAAREVLAHHDPACPQAAAGALRRIWLAASPAPAAELPAGQKQLLRDWGIHQEGFEAAGVPVPVLTAMGRELGRPARRRVLDYLPLVRLLWQDYGREGRIVAVVALGPMELADPETVVPLLGELAATCVFWEDCDQLAMKALEPVLRRDPGTWLEPIGAWVGDGNKWVRRAALTAIGRLPMARPEVAARCVELVAPALGDPDLDVKRALSFALRVSARGQIEPVKRFLAAQGDVRDANRLWVLCDVIRSMTRTLLPLFADLLPVYRTWLETAEPKARRSVEGAIRLLEEVQPPQRREGV